MPLAIEITEEEIFLKKTSGSVIEKTLCKYMELKPPLLTRYRESRCSSDFEAIVAHYAGMLIGVAQRRTGDRGLAEEVVQNVFILLAKKADKIDPDQLGGWLHRSTLLEANNAARKNARLRNKHKSFAQTMDNEPTTKIDDLENWHEIAPLLDTVIDTLPEVERKALMLRFFEQRTYREIGAQLGLGEDAGRKRIQAALGKLQKALLRRSVVSTTTVLAACLANEAAKAASPSIIQSFTQSALASAATKTSLTTTLSYLMVTTKFTAPILVCLGAMIPISIAWVNSPDSSRFEKNQRNMPTVQLKTNSAPHKSKTRTARSVSISNKNLDFENLVREISQLPFSERAIERRVTLQLAILELTQEQVFELVTVLKAAPNPSTLGSVAEALYARWAQFDPDTAMKDATALENWHLRIIARGAASSIWAANDPTAALAFLASVPEGKSNSSLAYSTLSVIVERDPADAMAQVEKIEDADTRKALTERVITLWSEEEPKEAFAWCQSLEDMTLRSRYSEALLACTARSDPKTTLELAIKMDHPIQTRNAIIRALRLWGEKDLEGATEAYLALPQSIRTQKFTMQIAHLIIPNDLKSARNWIQRTQKTPNSQQDN